MLLLSTFFYLSSTLTPSAVLCMCICMLVYFHLQLFASFYLHAYLSPVLPYPRYSPPYRYCNTCMQDAKKVSPFLGSLVARSPEDLSSSFWALPVFSFNFWPVVCLLSFSRMNQHALVKGEQPDYLLLACEGSLLKLNLILHKF